MDGRRNPGVLEAAVRRWRHGYNSGSTGYNEVLFIDMEPESGEFEPLLGCIALEQCGAAVDLVGHRLLPVRYMDAKTSAKRSATPVPEPPAQPRPVGIDRGMDVPATFFEPLTDELRDAVEGDDEQA